MKKILLSIFLCLPFLLSAQPYTIKHLSIREGLSNNHVVSIAQDKRGSLWFATEEGLNKFDGIRFLTYYKEETTGKQSITGNELNCLLDDPVDSILWIGTQRAGINAYNYANDSFITYRHNENNPESLVTDDITKIIAASDGNLWICTYWKGVDYFDKQTGQFTHYNTETVPGFASNHIWSAIDGGNGLLYIGHVDRGFSILSIKDKTVKNVTHEPQTPNSLPGNEVTCVYKDKSGNIWIGTDRGVEMCIRDRAESVFRVRQCAHTPLPNSGTSHRPRNRDVYKRQIKNGMRIRVVRIIHFIADTPQENTGMIAVTTYHIGYVPFYPLLEEVESTVITRSTHIPALYPFAFRKLPFVRDFIHYKKSQAVTQFIKNGGLWVMAHADGIYANPFQVIQAAFPYLRRHYCTQHSCIMM